MYSWLVFFLIWSRGLPCAVFSRRGSTANCRRASGCEVFFFLLNGGAETLRTGPRGRGHIRSATSLPSARRQAAGSRCRRSQLLTPNGGSSRSSRSMLMSAASTVIYSIFNPRLSLSLVSPGEEVNRNSEGGGTSVLFHQNNNHHQDVTT